MKKIAVLVTVIMLFSLVFTACTASPGTEGTTVQDTTLSPVNGTDEAVTEDVFAGAESEETTAGNTEESIFYVG